MPLPVMGSHPSLLSPPPLPPSSLLCFRSRSHGALFFRFHLLQIAHKSPSKRPQNPLSGSIFCSCRVKVPNQSDLMLSSSPFLYTEEEQQQQQQQQQPSHQHHPLEGNSISSEAVFLTKLVDMFFGPPIFNASKLKVMFLGATLDEHPQILPRIYTLTHCDITAMLTLTISQSINKMQLQGWYQRLQRDDVIAIWRKCQGAMSLHVHCHISGDHMLLETFASLRFYIFKKELPLVLEAFRHADRALLTVYPELDEAPVWVHFHSNVKEFNRVECWGPLESGGQGICKELIMEHSKTKPIECEVPCHCCFPRLNKIRS